MPATTHTPHLHNDADRFFNEVALEAGISFDEAREAADAVIEALAKRLSADRLTQLLGQLSHELREELQPAVPANEPADLPAAAEGQAAETAEETTAAGPASLLEFEDIRIERLEQATQAAIDALHALVEDLEELPSEEPHPERITKAARHAHQVLLEAWRRD